jgi:hypothetical protein
MTLSLVHPVLAAIETGGTAEPQVSLGTAMLCVFLVVLGYMGKRLADLGRSVRALEERLAAASVVATGAHQASGPVAGHHVDSDEDTETAVVIAATVAALWGPSARVVSFGETYGGARLWAVEGRRQIFASHKIR